MSLTKTGSSLEWPAPELGSWPWQPAYAFTKHLLGVGHFGRVSQSFHDFEEKTARSPHHLRKVGLALNRAEGGHGQHFAKRLYNLEPSPKTVGFTRFHLVSHEASREPAIGPWPTGKLYSSYSTLDKSKFLQAFDGL